VPRPALPLPGPGRPGAAVVSTALGVLLLVDVLRVFLPSIITIYGQAASTPAELMGGFALLWFLAGFAMPSLARLAGPPRFAAAAAGVLAVARLVLLATDGGQPQLYVAAVGLLAGLGWLVGTAMSPPPYATLAVVGGLALAGAHHAALGTVDLTWRRGALGWSLAAVEVAVFLWYAVRPAPVRGDPPAAAGWLLIGPAILLTGMITNSPALATVAGSGSTPGHPLVAPANPLVAPALFAVSAALGVAAALWPWRRLVPRALAVGALVAGVALVAYGPPDVLAVAIPLAALGLGAGVGVAARGERRTPARHGYALAAGMVIFAVATIVYYAGYDLGYPSQWVPPAVAVFVGGYALRSRASGVPDEVARTWRLAAAAVVVLPAMAGTWWSPPEPVARPNATALRVVTYNIRMGYGLDGTFGPDALARAIAGERPDVVLLGEVDRAWLLNGGHDDLQVLARRLDLRYVFAPAADNVWGDAILTNAPMLRTRTIRLSSAGAVTGAQALGVVVRIGGREVAVVGTHLQPPPDGPPLVQAREVAQFATDFGAGLPTVIGGDLNVTPDSETVHILTGAGYVDALAAARPVLTFPSDAPEQEIDHVLARGFGPATDVNAPRTTASDHLPVAVTLALP